MKRLALATLLFLSLTFGAAAPAWGQACATPAPTYTPTPGYRATVQAVAPGHLLVYYPLNETSGTAALDDSGNTANGTYSGVTLNSTTFLTGESAGSWDGVNDFVDFYTSYFASAFNKTEGTIMIWAKVGSGFWTDGIQRFFIDIRTDINNRVFMVKLPTSNILRLNHIGGATNRIIDTTPTPTSWFVLVLTWSSTGNSVTAYYNGAVLGTPQIGPAAWTGTLAPANVAIGAIGTSGSNPFYGNLAQAAVWDVAINSTQAAALATVDPVLTIPPTATLCPTYTPTNTPSWTPTFTPTPTNTPNLYHFWTLPAPAGTPLPGVTGTPTPAPGQDVVFVSDMNAGQVGIVLFLAAILISLLIMWLFMLLTVKRTKPKTPPKSS